MMPEHGALSRRLSHWLIFLSFIVFIAITGFVMDFFSERLHEKSTEAQDIKPSSTRPATLLSSVDDIKKNPLLHVKQQQLQVYFNQAAVMLHAKKYELSIVALHKVLEIDPKMPEAHINMGFSLLGVKKNEAARDFFLTALELDDTQLNAFYGLALSHEKLAEYQSAIAALVSYIHLSPQDNPYLKISHQKLQAWRKLVSEKDTKDE